MTPEELNDLTQAVRADLEATALDPLILGYRRVLRSAGRTMARELRRHAAVTAAILPPDEDEVVPPQLRERLERLTGRERRELVGALIEAYAAQEIAFDVAPAVTGELLEKVGAHAVFAADAELRQVYRDVIERAAAEGLSIPHTAREIVAAVDGVAEVRATALARTDLISLANGASQAIATDTFAGREDVTKVWLATDDDRTRETHLDANGQEVPLNDFFNVGGYDMLYPGDPDGPDEEVINCRCTLIYSGGGGGSEGEAEVASAGNGFEVLRSTGIPFVVVRPSTYSAVMPWHVEENHQGCPDGKPFAVVKDDDGDVEGCHASRPEAEAQMRALYASEENAVSGTEAATAAVTITVDDEAHAEERAERERVPWEGILAIAGSPTSDGRYLIPGEVGQRDLPLPLAGSHEKQHETETVGRIEDIEHIPAAEFAKEGWELPDELPPQAVVIWGQGTFDGSPAADDALRQLENGVGVSLDLPVERQAIIDATTYEEVDPTTLDEDDMLGLMFGMAPDGYLRGIGGKIGGLSLASIAAFEETTIRIVDDHAIVASGFAIRERQDPFLASLIAAVSAPIEVTPPIAPPRAWFFRDEPDEPTPVTILPTGEVFFHLALWNTCHAGRANGAYSSCMFAPHSRTNYSQFHLGAILCDDGTEVPIGRLTIGTGHAPLHLGAAAARKHYDHSGTCVAFGRMVDGVFGPFFSGVIKSDATAEQIRDLRACPPSGDWRAHDGRLELQAALAVNAPGYVVPRSQLSLAASAETLEIATLILSAPNDEDFAEALRAEHLVAREEDVNLLVELGALDLLRDVALVRAGHK